MHLHLLTQSIRVVRRNEKYKPESVREISKRAVQRARQTTCLHPHELLKYWANGVAIAGVTPTPEMQVSAAIAAAPYFASKLQAIEVKSETTIRSVISASPMTVGEWAARYSIEKAEALPSLPAPPCDSVVGTDHIVYPALAESEDEHSEDDDEL